MSTLEETRPCIIEEAEPIDGITREELKSYGLETVDEVSISTNSAVVNNINKEVLEELESQRLFNPTSSASQKEQLFNTPTTKIERNHINMKRNTSDRNSMSAFQSNLNIICEDEDENTVLADLPKLPPKKLSSKRLSSNFKLLSDINFNKPKPFSMEIEDEQIEGEENIKEWIEKLKNSEIELVEKKKQDSFFFTDKNTLDDIKDVNKKAVLEDYPFADSTSIKRRNIQDVNREWEQSCIGLVSESLPKVAFFENEEIDLKDSTDLKKSAIISSYKSQNTLHSSSAPVESKYLENNLHDKTETHLNLNSTGDDKISINEDKFHKTLENLKFDDVEMKEGLIDEKYQKGRKDYSKKEKKFKLKKLFASKSFMKAKSQKVDERNAKYANISNELLESQELEDFYNIPEEHDTSSNKRGSIWKKLKRFFSFNNTQVNELELPI
ncbi:hypothetical protein HK099_002534, partial [Clydaea vesicula]